jgi:hypothetical protein
MCRLILTILSLLYGLALLLWLAGIFGWLGIEQDSLSGIFLILLGQPWVRLVDFLPEAVWPLASALSPAISLVVIAAICKIVRKPTT